MSDYPVRLPLKRAPTHPGELMREILEDHLELTKTTAAERMGISRQSLYDVLEGKRAVTAEMALRFERIGGGEPQLLLNMQAAYDLWHARRVLERV